MLQSLGIDAMLDGQQRLFVIVNVLVFRSRTKLPYWERSDNLSTNRGGPPSESTSPSLVFLSSLVHLVDNVVTFQIASFFILLMTRSTVRALHTGHIPVVGRCRIRPVELFIQQFLFISFLLSSSNAAQQLAPV